MSKRGAKVIILCRNQDKAKEAAEEISGKTGGLVSYEKLDLASLASVRECTNELLGKEDKIDILINNAGVMNCPNWKTEDGFDMQLGTNHLGHFLLTELLMPLLKESAATGFHPRCIIHPSICCCLIQNLQLSLQDCQCFKQGTLIWFNELGRPQLG